MRLSVPPFVILLVMVASSCGRLGYDEIVGLGGDSSENGGATGGASSGPDSGIVADGGSSGSGGASGGRTAAGGTDSGTTGSGGTVTPGSGGTLGSGGAIDGGGTLGSGGAIDGGGTLGSGGAIDGGGTLGSGGAIDGGGTAGSGGSPVIGDAGIVGCADGQRDGFPNLSTHPAIAACAGGFALPGVVGLSGPACGRTAGDDGGNPNGVACNAADLCAVGFHICSSAAEVALKSSTGCIGSAVGATPEFFATAQSGLGARACNATGTDDLFGCGSLGSRPANGSNCTPLDRWSIDQCSGLVTPWSCGSDPTAEALNVVKPGPAAGGVLCCQD